MEAKHANELRGGNSARRFANVAAGERTPLIGRVKHPRCHAHLRGFRACSGPLNRDGLWTQKPLTENASIARQEKRSVQKAIVARSAWGLPQFGNCRTIASKMRWVLKQGWPCSSRTVIASSCRSALGITFFDHSARACAASALAAAKSGNSKPMSSTIASSYFHPNRSKSEA